MYEARQNKEKVSRRIGGEGGMARQKKKIEDKKGYIRQYKFDDSLIIFTDKEIIQLLDEYYDISSLLDDNIKKERENCNISYNILSLAKKLNLKRKNIIQTNQQNISNSDSDFFVYRADGRKFSSINSAGGFFAKNDISIKHAREIVKKWFLGNTGNTYLQNWISNPDNAGNYLISCGVDNDCGGQTGTKKGDEIFDDIINGKKRQYRNIYKIKLPSNFKKVNPTKKNLDISYNPSKIKRGFKAVELYMNADTLNQATLIAFKSDVEYTFLTHIPSSLIEGFLCEEKEKGKVFNEDIVSDSFVTSDL